MPSPALQRADSTTTRPLLKELWDLNGVPAHLVMVAVLLCRVLGYSSGDQACKSLQSP
jgi:hypothetical protein